MRVRSGVAAIVISTWATCASAQYLPGFQPSDRPFQGLFGPSQPYANAQRPTRSQTLDLNASLEVGYDDNATASVFGQPNNLLFQKSSPYYGANASLAYGRETENRTFGASGGVGYRYYSQVEPPDVTWYSAAAGFSRELGRRNRLRADGSVSYAPYYAFGGLPAFGSGSVGGLPPSAIEAAVFGQKALTYGANAFLSRRQTKVDTLELYYNFYRTDFREAGFQDLNWQGVGGRWLHQFAKYANTRLGYAYRRGRYTGGTGVSGAPLPVNDTDSHDIDAGVDYGRSFGLTRRTRFSFSTGTSVFRGSTTDKTYFNVIGSATLTHEINRAWQAAINYNRSLNYTYGFSEPLYTDMLSAGIGGYVNARLGLSAIADYQHGSVGVTLAGNGFNTAGASVGGQYALTRNLALDARYYFYHYFFESGVRLPPGFAPKLDRNSVTVSLTAWVPLLR